MTPRSHIGSKPGKNLLPPVDAGVRERILLVALILIAACATAVVLYLDDRRSFLYFGDGVSHLVRARHFIDSQRPGIDNLGTVWLPLPHLLLLPFAMIDALFFTGIAAPVVGIPLLAGTGLLLHAMLFELTGSRSISFLGACVYALNPNILYMALTPMNEPSLLFLIPLGGYAFLRWLKSEHERWLFLCAAAVALATLCRYEAWLLPSFVTFVVLVKAPSRGRRFREGAGARMILAAGLSWSGIAFWLGWNLVEYGDPFKFARWTYATLEGTRASQLRDPQNLVGIFTTALLVIFGPALLLACTGLFFRMRRLRAERPLALLLLFLGLPALFTVAALAAGFVRVDRWWWNWRYILILAPFLTTAGGIGIAEFFLRVRSALARGGAVALLLATPLAQIALPSVGIATYEDAAKGFRDDTRFTTAIGERLGRAYRGGTIGLMTGYGPSQRIMITAGLALKSYTLIYNPDEMTFVGPNSLRDRYMVIGKERSEESRQAVDYWLYRREELMREYGVLYEDEHFLLLERK